MHTIQDLIVRVNKLPDGIKKDAENHLTVVCKSIENKKHDYLWHMIKLIKIFNEYGV